MIVAIIPARGGSKRIPNKNIKLFLGIPLIEYSIRAAKKTGLFDKIIVSTDSSEIADIAEKAGAEVPFLRPIELSDDYIPTVPVLKHAVGWLVSNSVRFEEFCCIYCNPFVTPENLIKGHNLLKEKRANSVVPVTAFPFPIFRGVKISSTGALEYFFPENILTRSQDLPEAYHDTGQFYWWDRKFFMNTGEIQKLPAIKRFPLIVPRYFSQDIDTMDDWEYAEKLYKIYLEK